MTNAPLQSVGSCRAKSTCAFLWVEMRNPLNASQLLLSFENARFSVPMTVCSPPCDSHRFSADNHAEPFCINIRINPRSFGFLARPPVACYRNGRKKSERIEYKHLQMRLLPIHFTLEMPIAMQVHLLPMIIQRYRSDFFPNWKENPHFFCSFIIYCVSLWPTLGYHGHSMRG